MNRKEVLDLLRKAKNEFDLAFKDWSDSDFKSNKLRILAARKQRLFQNAESALSKILNKENDDSCQESPPAWPPIQRLKESEGG